MNTRYFITTAATALTGMLTLFTLSAAAGPSVQVKVTGQDDELVDRAAIQAAIDSAPGQPLTVKLRGIFQLDGHDIVINRSDLTIKGDRGAAKLKGILDANGDPVDDIENFPNRGIFIEPDGLVSNVEIKDLEISGCRTGVFARAVAGALRGLTVKNVHVDGCFNGLVVVGDAQDITLAGNLVRDTSSVGVFLRDAAGAALAGARVTDNRVEGDNASGILVERHGNGIGDIVLANNHVTGSTQQALALAGTHRVSVVDNHLSTNDVSDLPFPIITVGPNSDLLIEANVFEGGAAAAMFLGNAANATVTRNCVRNGGSQGFLGFAGGGIRVGIFGIPGTGFDIADNSYENNHAAPGPVPRDVWLTGSASDTSAHEEPGVVVVNDGANNTVGAIPDDGVNHCDGA